MHAFAFYSFSALLPGRTRHERARAFRCSLHVLLVLRTNGNRRVHPGLTWRGESRQARQQEESKATGSSPEKEPRPIEREHQLPELSDRCVYRPLSKLVDDGAKEQDEVGHSSTSSTRILRGDYGRRTVANDTVVPPPTHTHMFTGGLAHDRVFDGGVRVQAAALGGPDSCGGQSMDPGGLCRHRSST
jgi:hypothetical protein